MTSGWWLDGALFSLAAIFGYLFWQIETHDIFHKVEDNEGGRDRAQSWSALEPRQERTFYGSRLMRQAGLRPQFMQPLFWAMKLVCAMLFPLLAVEFNGGQAEWVLLLLPALAGFFLPEAWLLVRRQKRRREIAGSLSFFISLMVVYLKSGLNLAQGFRQAATYGLKSNSPLARELDLLSHEIDAGRDRDAAFALLAERTGVEPLKRLASVISVGYQTGSPVVGTLQAQADMLRARQSQEATELVNRKSMEIMIPMLMVCFPMFIVLVLFPAAVQLLDVLKMIGELF